MVKTDEDALICDLAETYRIFDYKQLPLMMVAVFSCGLRDNSRIKLKMAEQPVPNDILLLAQITDGINMLLWSKTEDAEKGKNRPESIASALLGSGSHVANTASFASGEEYEQARQRILKEGGN